MKKLPKKTVFAVFFLLIAVLLCSFLSPSFAEDNQSESIDISAIVVEPQSDPVDIPGAVVELQSDRVEILDAVVEVKSDQSIITIGSGKRIL